MLKPHALDQMREKPMESKRKLMIAEDEPLMRLAIKEALAGLEGYEVIEAIDGLDALQVIEKEHPSVVILDLLMPKMDGFELLEALRDRPEPQRLPKVIVLSALVKPNLVEQLHKLGVQRVISKPFHINDLVNTVAEVARAPVESGRGDQLPYYRAYP